MKQGQWTRGGSMRWTRWTLVSLTAGAVVTAIAAVSCTQVPRGPAEMTAADVVSRLSTPGSSHGPCR